MQHRLIFGMLIGLFLAQPAFGQEAAKRVALVIGNGAYERSSDELINPANDAGDIANKLTGLGFLVIEAIDLDLAAMQARLLEFAEALEGAEAGLFFYAGHGMEYAGRNYLFPTDAELQRETDVRLKLIDVADILWTMETAVPTRLVILDACRDNPFALQLQEKLPPSRSAKVRQGLAPLDTKAGTFMAYATAPGDVASDGFGRNSPFSEAMLTHLDVPGLDIDQLMRDVRNDVIDATDQRQVPWNTSSLRAPFVINRDGVVENEADVETLVWQSIEFSDDPDVFRAYLERFGDGGRYAPDAYERLAAVPAQARNNLPDPRGQYSLFEPSTIAMDGRIILACSKSSKRPHFGLTANPKPLEVEVIERNGYRARATTPDNTEQIERLIAYSADDLNMVLIQAKRIPCLIADKLSTDARGAQWRSWRYLLDGEGDRTGSERGNWSGQGGSFRIESELVTLAAAPSQSQCRAFVAYNVTQKRAFAGYACGQSTPEIAQLTPIFELLEWH